MAVMTSISSCKDVSIYLPMFVTEAKEVEAVRFTRQDNNVEFRIVFVAATDKAKKDFDQLQGDYFCRSSRKNELVVCDGPCGEMCPPKDIVQFGDCDHNICDNCMDSSAKRLFDGSRGCCNAACLKRKTSSRVASRKNSVRLSRESKKRRSKKKQSKTSKTESSKSHKVDSGINLHVPKAIESNQIVLVSLFVFYLEKKRIVRRCLELELLGNTRASFLLEKAKSFYTKSGRCRFYYTTKSRFDRKDLIEICNYETTTLDQLAGGEEMLSVLIATPGTSI